MKHTTDITIDSETISKTVILPELTSQVTLQYLSCDQTPQVGSPVQLIDKESGLVRDGTTDHEGIVVFKGVPFGLYSATIEYY